MTIETPTNTFVSEASVKKIFDVSLYPQVENDEKRLTNYNIVEDLAGLALEAGDGPLEECINPKEFTIVGGQIYDIETGENVLNELSYDNHPLTVAETSSARSFWGDLLTTAKFTIAFSPPGGMSPYEEGRINVAYLKDCETIEFYAIPTRITPVEMLRLANTLNEFSQGQYAVSNPDDLRSISIPLYIPESERNLWGFLDKVAKIDSPAWEAINSGSPWIIKSKAIDSARIAVKNSMSFILSARNELGFVRAGAHLENQMLAMGWAFRASACPGKFNSELLGQNDMLTKFGGSVFAKDGFGNMRQITMEDKASWVYTSGKCRDCESENVDVGPCNLCKTCEKKYD